MQCAEYVTYYLALPKLLSKFKKIQHHFTFEIPIDNSYLTNYVTINYHCQLDEEVTVIIKTY